MASERRRIRKGNSRMTSILLSLWWGPRSRHSVLLQEITTATSLPQQDHNSPCFFPRYSPPTSKSVHSWQPQRRIQSHLFHVVTWAGTFRRGWWGRPAPLLLLGPEHLGCLPMAAIGRRVKMWPFSRKQVTYLSWPAPCCPSIACAWWFTEPPRSFFHI